MARGKTPGRSRVLQPIVKVHLIRPPRIPPVLGRLGDPGDQASDIPGTEKPPFDLEQLVRVWENSSTLPVCVSAYAQDIEGHGLRFVPAIDLFAPDAEDRVEEQLFMAAVAEHDRRGSERITDPTRLLEAGPLQVEPPDKATVRAQLVRLRLASRVQLARAQAFVASCYPGGSFGGLRVQARTDIEITGNSWIELVRNADGLPGRLQPLPVGQMRLTPLDPEPTEIEILVRVGDLIWERVQQAMYFRRHVLIKDQKIALYYKEYGDPRTISRRTGKAYEDLDLLQRAEGHRDEAHEVLHQKVYHPKHAYGVPRWIGATPAVLAGREGEEVNLEYFRDNTVPPLALLVSGGKFRDGIVETLQDFFRGRRGHESFHKLVVLEAELSRNASGSPGPAPKIDIKPLRDVQLIDGVFLGHDDRVVDKVFSMFRLPRLLGGRDRAMNRSVAFAAMQVAEEQVFAPIRAEQDDFYNRAMLPELGVTLWKIRSNGPSTRDPTVLAAAITALSKSATLTINEARELATGVFNKDFPPIAAPWAALPLPVLLMRAADPAVAAKLLEAVPDLSTDLLTGEVEDALRSPADTDARPTSEAAEPSTPPAPSSESGPQAVQKGRRRRRG